MRRPFTVYEREGSPVWWFNFRIRGARFRGPTKVPRGKSNEGAATQEAAAVWLAECDRRGAPADAEACGLEVATLSLLELFVDSDLAARARRRADRYADSIEADLAKHVVSRFPIVSQITTAAWERATGHMHADGVKLRTIQKVTVSLRLFLRFCRARGAIGSVPALVAPSGEEVAAEQAERRAMTAAERDRLLATLRRADRRAFRIYTVMFYAALRKSTVEKLLPRWIDRRTGYVRLPAAALKTKRDRELYLHPKARAAIREELATRGRIDPDRPIFGPFNYRRLFGEVAVAAKVPLHGLTPHHVARHTAATIAGNRGASLAELMALGLWKTAAMATRYLHVEAEQSKAAAERL